MILGIRIDYRSGASISIRILLYSKFLMLVFSVLLGLDRHFGLMRSAGFSKIQNNSHSENSKHFENWLFKMFTELTIFKMFTVFGVI